MKKTLKFSAMFAAILSVASCSERTIDVQTVEKGLVNKSVYAEIIDTKTALNGVKTTWVKDDEISVIDSVAAFKFVAANSGSATLFEGQITEGQNYIAAVYPYCATAARHKNNPAVMMTSIWPETITVADGTNLPLIANYTNGSLKFRPLSAVVKFTIKAEDAGKFKSVKVTDYDGKINMSAGLVNINLTSGNMTINQNGKNSVQYEPESGSIAAGTYFIPIITVGADTTVKVFENGLKFGFTTTDDKYAEISNPGKAFNMARGHIYNFGTLSPVFEEQDSRPYGYTNLKRSFNSIINVTQFSTKTNCLNASVSGNVLTFSDYAGRSVAGATITAKAIASFAGDKSNYAFDSYFTTNVTDLAAGDTFVYKVPVNQTIKGDIAFCFNLTNNKLTVDGNWTGAWSKDGSNWKDIEKFYAAGSVGTTYNLVSNGGSKNDGVCTAHIKISDADELHSGDFLYFKVTLGSTPSSTEGTVRMNLGSIVADWPGNNDYASDSNVVLAYGFDDVDGNLNDVMGCFLSHFMGSPEVALAKEGWTFSDVTGRLRCARFTATANCYIETPALTSLTKATDVILSFAVSPIQAPKAIETPEITVSISGAGVLGEVHYTKPYVESAGEWTVAHVLITGADSTTKIKIAKDGTSGRADIDEIVIFKK